MHTMIEYFAVMITVVVGAWLLLFGLVLQFAQDLKQRRLNNRLNNLEVRR